MTQKEAQMWKFEIIAFSNGAKIQYAEPGRGWVDCPEPRWSERYLYRIKPQPEYVPLDLLDTERIIMTIIIEKKTGINKVITEVKENGVYAGSGSILFEKLLNEFTFADGTPCGKLKQ